MNAKTANEIPISALHLSARTYNALSNDGIETVADPVQYSHQDLLSLRNFGRRSLYEVEAALAGHSAALAKAPGKKQPAYAALIKATLAGKRF
jgi:DNA-directed RNA polymerase alpha subunit